MSDEILGHDVNGEALRAGDRVEIVRARVSKEFEGTEATITGPWPEHLAQFDCDVDTDIRHPIPIFHPTRGALCWQLRRINSGRDVFEQARDRALSQGSPDAQHEWTEPTTSQWAQAVLSGMPWTEPGR